MTFPNNFSRFRRHGRGNRKVPGTMNSGEKAYAAHLFVLQSAGAIEWYGFEKATFKLADDTRYTPDFMVMLPDGTIEFHDVKGGKKKKINGVATGERTYWCEEDAKLKIKIAAEILPFRFSIVFPIGGGKWGRKDFFETTTAEARQCAEDSPVVSAEPAASHPLFDDSPAITTFMETSQP